MGAAISSLGASPPSAPNYSAITSSDMNAANYSLSNMQNQYNWAQQAYWNQLPYTQNFMNQMASYGQQAAQMQQNLYFPVQQQFVQSAMGYNTPAQQARASAAAQADVAQNFQGQRTAALQSLESFGIDPSQTRYGSLDLGTRITQAASQASAGTQARLNSEMTGLSLQQAASGMGFTQAGLQTSTGQAGVGAGLNTMTTGGNLMGTGPTWGNLGIGALGGAAQATNAGFANQLGAYNAQAALAQNTSAGIGQGIGALGGLATLAFSDRRLKEDIREVGTTRMGIPVVTFRYKGDPVTRMGVIAQDVEKKFPEAVKTINGLKGVDYRRIA